MMTPIKECFPCKSLTKLLLNAQQNSFNSWCRVSHNASQSKNWHGHSDANFSQTTFRGNAKNIWIYPCNYFKRMCPGQCVGSADIQAPREPYGFIELLSDLTQQPQMRKVNRIRAKKSQITMPQLQHSYARADRGPLCAELSCVEKTGTWSHHPSKTHHTVAGI